MRKQIFSIHRWISCRWFERGKNKLIWPFIGLLPEPASSHYNCLSTYGLVTKFSGNIEDEMLFSEIYTYANVTMRTHATKYWGFAFAHVCKWICTWSLPGANVNYLHTWVNLLTCVNAFTWPFLLTYANLHICK